MSPCAQKQKEEETLRCREFEARVCTLRLKVFKRKSIWLHTMYFQKKNQNNQMSNPHQPWQQIVINHNARGVRESERERDAFCTIDKKNLCEPRFKLTAIIQLRFYLSRERD